MKQSRRRTIGVLTPYTGGFYYGAVLEGIQRAARDHDTVVVAFQTSGLELYWADTGQYFGIDTVDAWILLNEFESEPYTREILRRGTPLICVNARLPGVKACSVLPDNLGGTQAAVAHLIEHGHRRIAFVGSLHQFDLQERYEGYLAAHQEAGLQVDEALFFRTDANFELDGRLLGKRLVAEGFAFTALAAGTDNLALGLLAELTEAGYRVPQDVALIAFDDIDKAQYAEPPLSTVRQNFTQLARIATKKLIDHLTRGVPLPEVVRVPTVFVQRKSCGCTTSHTLPPPSLHGTLVERRRYLARELLRVASRTTDSTLPSANWPEATTIAELLVATCGGAPPAIVKLGGIWKGFLEHNRDAESMDRVMALLERTGRSWSADWEQHLELRGLLRDLRISLLSDWQRAEQQRLRSYELAAEASGKINQLLSRSHSTVATDLSWLGWTQSRYGCLGVWTNDGSGRQLEILREFRSDGGAGILGNTRFAANQFPPASICDLAQKLDPRSVLTVVPLLSRGPNRGLLVIAAPVDAERLDHLGNIGDWAAQVGASLDRAEIEQQLRQSAQHDPLTGLLNRSSVLERLEELNSSAEGSSYAVLFFDLDDFKKINDGLGHLAGDQLLIQFARRLEHLLDGNHIIARLGGDEFVVIAPGADEEAQVSELVRLVQDVARSPFHIDQDTVFTTCSIGVSFSEPELAAADVLRHADTAMHRAKVQGRARHEVFHRGMHAHAVERLRLDTRLRQALEQGQFKLYYQPIVALATGQDVGAEALLRWEHPEHGLLSPSRFLAVAEDVGLAVPISQWVLKTACEQARSLPFHGSNSRYVSVNVPAQHLQQPDFVSYVEGLLARYDLSPRSVGIEIVESSLIEYRSATTKALARLMEIGMRVAIDDFGTGYSSLAYLKDFPVSVLKVDRSFVMHVPKDPKDTAIAKAMVTMGQGLGLSIVAEGVETEEQLDFMRSIGCDYVQGFLTGVPMSRQDWERRLLAVYAAYAV